MATTKVLGALAAICVPFAAIAVPAQAAPASTLSNPFPNGIQAAPGRNPIYQQLFLGTSMGGHADPYYSNQSYTYQWNFTLQHQLPSDIAIEAGYSGLRGIHLGLGRQYNQINPQYLALGSQLKSMVANPFYGRITVGALSAPLVQYGQLLSPYPQYTSVSAPASMQLKLSHTLIVTFGGRCSPCRTTSKWA